MLLSFPPVAIRPLGYVSLGAMTHTQDTKFEWPDIQCISVNPLSGLLRGADRKQRHDFYINLIREIIEPVIPEILVIETS